MFFPYKDDNPQILIPYVTYSIIGINLLVFLYQFALSDISDLAFTLSYGLIPAMATDISADQIVFAFSQQISSYAAADELVATANPHSPFITMFTSMFMHGGIAHIIGNMWFLWIFGDNVESALGHKRFASFYLLSGIAAGLCQMAVDIHSIVPMIGASGAVSGILAGYMIRYPRARVHVFVFLFIIITTIRVPAFVVIGFWFLEQLTNGLGAVGLNTSGGVAWFAHIGGFVAGIGLIYAFTRIKLVRA